jgi:hypothetical protein
VRPAYLPSAGNRLEPGREESNRPKRGYVARGECRQSRSCYVMGCENDTCRAEHRRWVTRNRMTRMNLNSFKHGPVGYDCGCRCEECVPSRARRYKREKAAALARIEAERRSTAKPDPPPSDRGSALVVTFLLGVIVTALVGAFLLGEQRRCDSLREQGSALVERYCGEER